MNDRLSWLLRTAETAARPRLTLNACPHEPIVSFTFDDFPRTALERAGGMLEERGWHGTFFTAFGMADSDWGSGPIGTEDELADAARRGHEIGSHTYGHLRCDETPLRTLREDLQTNQRAASRLGLTPRNFAYPYGALNPAAMRVCQRHFRSARATTWGVVRGRVDLMALNAVPLYSPAGMDTPLRFLRDAESNPAWLIFYTHDVTEHPSDYGCTPCHFQQILDATASSGATVLTVDAALTRLGAPS